MSDGIEPGKCLLVSIEWGLFGDCFHLGGPKKQLKRLIILAPRKLIITVPARMERKS